MGFLDTLRRWVDGEDGEDALSRAATEQAKPRRQAEEFIAEIARSIGQVMQSEAVPMPPDQTVIPPEYIVFLSDEDDRDWQGVKRRALETGLYHVLAEHARDLAGKTKLATTSFTVELRVDGTLNRGEVRVQHSWEESSSQNKTSITPRRKNSAPLIQPAGQSGSGAQSANTTTNQPNAQFNPAHQQTNSPNAQPSFSGQSNAIPARSSQLAPTMFGNEPTQTQPANVEDATRVSARGVASGNSYDESTRVAPRELYKLEIWRNNQRQAVVPVSKDEITIGRKSQKVESDVMLDGDPEVSRPHAILRRESDGKYYLIHKGKNPTIVAGREIAAEQPYPIAPGEPVSICSFMLRIQPQ